MNTIQYYTRNGDPATSRAAGEKAAKYSPEVIRKVANTMDDGVARIDEEIHEATVASGYKKTADAIRHGRGALVARGYLVPTGKTRATKTGGEQSQEWVRRQTVPSIITVVDFDLQNEASVRAAEAKQRREEKKAAKKAAKEGKAVQTELPLDAAAPTHCPTCTCGTH